ncbi:MAG: hypothetical protein JOZ14_17540 [Acidobacteria bacterium]|nr:hypothetical protein [Acidobacteriota bacterium]
MKNTTDTLVIGSTAPAFQLGAANSYDRLSLSQLISCGPLIVEFLRGTW